VTGSTGDGGAGERLEAVTAELLDLYEEINVLYSVSEIAAASADVTAVGKRILEEAVALLSADVGFILFHSDDLRGEEPETIGLPLEECRAMGELLTMKLLPGSAAEVIAPFTEGASIPRAPVAVVAAPLMTQGERLGLICLGRRGQGATFTAGDQKIVSVLATQAALVLSQRRNLDLSRLARRLEERTAALKGVVEVGREITSTLELDRVLRSVADLPAKVLGFDRCGVLLERGGRFRIRALSGATRVDRAAPDVASLEKLLVWVAGKKSGFAAWLENEEGEREQMRCEVLPVGATTREEAATPGFEGQAREHFGVSGGRAILAIPLIDDQGTLGVIGLESEDSDALTEAAREAALVLAHQATVAIRNGRLYRDLPFISVLEPIQRGWKKAAGVSRRKMALWGGALAVAVFLGVVIPWEFRIPGSFTLHPARRIEVISPVRGVIREVRPLPEGSFVREGEPIAWLDDTDWRLRHNEAEWRLQAALREAVRLEVAGMAADVRIRRLEAERWEAERDLLSLKIEQAVLRAPSDGVLLTPRIREQTGELLEVGSILCTLADLKSLRAEIAIAEKDADALSVRLPVTAVLKLEAFPEWDLLARVDTVRPAAEEIAGVSFLVAEAVVTSPPEGLRPGMTGEARVTVGRRSVASLFLRGPYRFFMRRLWW
jgi:GAF domain-containing protein